MLFSHRPLCYTLAEDGKTPVPCEDVLEWRWYETATNRVVAQTDVGGFLLSTVFLGIDHSHGIGDRPILFETMCWHDDEIMDDYCERYHTWDEAAANHAAIVKLIAETYHVRIENG